MKFVKFLTFHISNHNTLAINSCGEKSISLFCNETGNEKGNEEMSMIQ